VTPTPTPTPTPAPTPAPDDARHLLRHTLATLAYRAEKVLRDAPDDFASFRASPVSRTPLDLVGHLGDLMDWADRLAQGEYVWAPVPVTGWTAACDRFFAALRSLDAALAAAPLDVYPPGVIFQGPIADALTHVGQLAMLRGIAGAAIRPESYARAEITVGRVGHDQSQARREFDGDASRRKT
jgi:hypothetical protein